MSAFDTINYIFFDKSKKELDHEIIEDFSPYLTTKAFSFIHRGKHANFINETLNRYPQIFTTTEDVFNFYNQIIPKMKRCKLDYIRKEKKEKVKAETDMSPIPDFYCKREMDILLTKKKD